jgi:hypothetical protein
MLLFLLPGWFLLRTEARRFVELLFHEPPRRLDRTPLSIIHDPTWHLKMDAGCFRPYLRAWPRVYPSFEKVGD